MNPEEITAHQLKTILESKEPPMVIDVREPFEMAAGMIPGAVPMPMNSVPLRLADLPRDKTIVAYCHLGERSWAVAQFLARRGFGDVKSLAGGIEAWNRQALTGR
jgi:rhodanese-related sulfurtransferase